MYKYVHITSPLPFSLFFLLCFLFKICPSLCCSVKSYKGSFKNPHAWLWLVWLCWLEYCLIYQNLGGSIPGQGRDLGCKFNLLSGCISGQVIDASLSHRFFFLSLPPTLSKIIQDQLGTQSRLTTTTLFLPCLFKSLSKSTVHTWNSSTSMEHAVRNANCPLWTPRTLFSPSSLLPILLFHYPFLPLLICWCSHVSALTHLIPLYAFFTGNVIHCHCFLLVSSLFLSTKVPSVPPALPLPKLSKLQKRGGIIATSSLLSYLHLMG